MTIDEQKSCAIRAAAERLKAAGQKVTLKAVREALGGGSFATIQPVLKAWRDEVLATPPAGLAKEVLRYIDLDGLVSHIRAQALADCEERIEQAERESAAALIRNEELEKQCRDLRFDLDAALSRTQEVAGRLMVAEHRAATLQQSEARLREDLNNLVEVAKEKAELEQTLHACTGRIADQQTEIARLLAGADTLRREWLEQHQQNAALEATVALLEKQKAEQAGTIARLQELLGART